MNYAETEAERTQKFNAACTADGREVLTSREAAKLFACGESTIREAARRNRIEPAFVLRLTKDTPVYLLSDLQTYFANRHQVDPDTLSLMRENGCGLWTRHGNWLILSFEKTVYATPEGRRHDEAEDRPYWEEAE